MTSRTYKQRCPVATALDLLGERWTLLIVRNLVHGPKRFTDLADDLPGIGTGLLSTRLRHLQDIGVIERATLPPPVELAVYQLTTDGQRLRPLILHLARWGLTRLKPSTAQSDAVSPTMVMIALESRFEPTKATGVDGVYELWIDRVPFRVEVHRSALTIRARPAENPRATLTTDTTTLVEINNGILQLSDAIASERLTIEGDTERTLALTHAFDLR